jgi:hypothetical protein
MKIRIFFLGRRIPFLPFVFDFGITDSLMVFDTETKPPNIPERDVSILSVTQSQP